MTFIEIKACDPSATVSNRIQVRIFLNTQKCPTIDL